MNFIGKIKEFSESMSWRNKMWTDKVKEVSDWVVSHDNFENLIAKYNSKFEMSLDRTVINECEYNSAKDVIESIERKLKKL